MRGRWGLVALTLLAAPLVPQPSSSSSEALAIERPNIVFLMVDDMRRDELRFMPRTRRLIGDQGATLTNAVMPNPMCCPSRASVLTGLHAHNHGVWSHRPPWGFHAFDDRSTLPVWLSQAGYATAYLGKYLNGYGEQPPPGEAEGRSTQYVPPGWDTWLGSIDGGLPASHPQEGSTYHYFDTTLNNNAQGYRNYAGRYQTNVYAQLATQQIKQLAAAEQPFFSYVSFTAPHFGDPVEKDDPGPVRDSWGDPDRWVRLVTPARPKRIRGAFDRVITRAPGRRWTSHHPSGLTGPSSRLRVISRVEWKRILELSRQRAEALAIADAAIGRILSSLADTGELDNTVVVFTSDNGYFLGEYRIRQGKTYPYAPSGRVPLLVRGPDIPAGIRLSDPYLNIDHAPTLAEAAGAEMPYEPDGHSLWDVLRDGRDRGWDAAVLVESAPKRPGEPNAVLGVRTADHLYARWRDGAEELFDLRKDRAERHNVVADPTYTDDLSRLRTLLGVLRDCRGDSCRPAAGQSAVDPSG